MQLENKVALITGGARIGAAVALGLAKKGCHVVLSYRNSQTKAEQTARLLIQHGVKSMIVHADMSKSGDVKKVATLIKKTFSRLDILINMASLYEKTPFVKLTEKDWNRFINDNLKCTFLTVQQMAPLLKKNKGRVINFSDWVAASGRPRYKSFLPYYAAKMGVVGLTQVQALELAPDVLVNCIAPGPILPPTRIKNEEIRNVVKVTPLRRWGGEEEISKAVLFFCESNFITGECLRVDGGRHLY